MKKVLIILFILYYSFAINAQSVAINTDNSVANASAMLDIKSINKGLLIPRLTLAQRNLIASPATSLMVYQTDNTPGYYYFNGNAWIQLSTSGSTNSWSLNSTHLFNNNPGNVGIGTSTPSSPLSFPNSLGNKISFWNAGANNDFGIGINTGVMQLYTAGTDKIAFGWGNANAFNETVAIHTGSGMLAYPNVVGNKISFWRAGPNNDYGIGINSGVMQIYTAGTDKIAFGWGNANAFNEKMTFYTGSSQLGIGITSPLGTLDVSRGTGFAGTALFRGTTHNSHFNFDVPENTYIRGGKTGSTVYLNDTHNGNVVIATGGGRVGIGTNTPRAALDVVGSVVNQFSFYSYVNSVSGVNGWQGQCSGCSGAISIYASDRIAAPEFDAYSDARIKNISGTSNTAKDLETIQALQIRDYTMKDKVKYGDKTFKKVIAQEVEKVYSQVVSKHTDFIPNVYQLTQKIEKTAGGYLLGFANHHHISKTAKKLQVLLGTEGMQQYDIVSIVSDTEVVINAIDIKTDKVFVYGEEVDDFRTVDYEGLTTLNISATQELAKLVEAQNKKIAALAEEIKMLKQNRFTSLNTKF